MGRRRSVRTRSANSAAQRAPHTLPKHVLPRETASRGHPPVEPPAVPTRRFGDAGTLMNLTAAAMGMLQNPMMREIIQYCHSRWIVWAKSAANSTMIAWTTAVKTITPMKMRFVMSPVKTFHSSMLRVLISLNT